MTGRQILVAAGVGLALLVVPSAVADAPTLSVPSSFTESVDGPGPYPVSYTVSAVDDNGPADISCDHPSGSDFSYGDTLVTCTATDTVDGTFSSGSFTVSVVDTTAPSLSGVPSSFAVEVVGLSSAAVTYATPTATDAGAPATPSCAPASGSTFSYGQTTVTCSISDAHGNTASQSFVVTLQDTIPPTVTPPTAVTVDVPSTPAAVTYPNATATEGATPVCSPASGSSFPLGQTTVTCGATDAAGNAATPVTFTVTVADTTPPAVAITGGPTGLVGTRSASFDFTTSEGSTSCQLDGAAFSSCSSPATYSNVGDGAHTFTVKGTDAAGNVATASRSWSIDATPPVLSVPGTLYIEADGPAGSLVRFGVSASDAGAALLQSAISCNPPSGSLFPIHSTLVRCQASDSLGNTGSAFFDVIVRDTTAPAINAPSVTFTATSADGIRKTDPAVVAYLAGVSANDLVSTPTLTNDMPAVLPVGTTPVVFTATDAAGNIATKSVTITVLAVGQKAPPPDLTPPADVAGAAAKAGDRSVTLTWRRPPADVAYVTVSELASGEAGVAKDIYRGTGTTVVAKGLVNGTEYRFLIIAYDRAGNRSKGVVLHAMPKAEKLTSPGLAERVGKPPLLRWAPVNGATYFNVQLWRGSTKVLSAWPAVNRYQLTSTWTFAGKKQKLTPGIYTWYVWPGLGARADAHYGALLGSRTFTVAATKKR